ncbi:MAG: efflux RND transporter permease subunit, partial [Steroidobacteraceae bacterium]
AFLAMSFTPALCAAILRPTSQEKKNFAFRWFNKGFARVTTTYFRQVGSAVRKAPRWLILFVLLAVLAGYLYTRLPTSFVPDEDQGFMLAIVNLPPGSTLQQTDRVLRALSEKLKKSEIGDNIDAIFSIEGFSFVGQSENVGMAFIRLTDWDKRSQTAMQLIGRANGILHGTPDAQVFVVNLPTIRGLSQFGGVDMFLQARAGQSRAELAKAQGALLENAAKDPSLTGVRPNSLPPAPQLSISVDRVQAQSLGLSLTDVYNAISLELAPVYVNQFSYQGRIKRVFLQADAPYRMGLDAFDHIYTPTGLASTSSSGAAGGSSSSLSAAAVGVAGYLAPVNPSATNTSIAPYNMVPLSSVVKKKWDVGPVALPRYNGYSAIEIVGNPATGYSTGQAMQTIQKIMDSKLPPGFAADWTGQSYQEILSGNAASMLLLLSVVVVFLCLAALYESWSIPVAVLLVVPLGMLGMLVFCKLSGTPNDIYFKIGLVTVIGLAAKNAILIVEFAVTGQQQGMKLYDAVMNASKLRLRPILMTSMAFIMGVFPLLVSSGAGAASRHEIGTGVIGGMLFATFLGVLFVPVFYVIVRRILGDKLDVVSQSISQHGENDRGEPAGTANV